MWKTKADEFGFKYMVDRYRRANMYSVGIAERVKRICKEVTNYSEENEGVFCCCYWR